MTAKAPLLFFACLFVFLAETHAETNYILDELYVPLRSGPGTQYRIVHKGLKSGLPFERLDESEDGGWVQIQTPSGLEGWVPEQYVSRAPTAAIKLAETRVRLDSSRNELKSTKEQLDSLNSEHKKLEQKLSQTENTQQQATMELHRIRSISSGAIELDQKYQKLLEDHELLQTQNDTLNAENTSLRDDRRFSFMFYGAALVVLGMLLAVIIPRLQFKKRNSEWVN